MSVLVKGMSIPDNCESCAFETGFGFCLAKSDNFCGYTNYRKRPEWCPLVEVPEPHGRLIDEAIVLEMIRKSMGIKDLSFLYHAEKSVVNEIFHAPTVIEAEGEG